MRRALDGVLTMSKPRQGFGDRLSHRKCFFLPAPGRFLHAWGLSGWFVDQRNGMDTFKCWSDVVSPGIAFGPLGCTWLRALGATRCS